MERESNVSLLASPVEAAFLDMMSVAYNLSRSVVVRRVMARYTELTAMIALNEPEAQIAAAFMVPGETPLTDDELADLWTVNLPQAHAQEYGLHDHEINPFMASWQANGGDTNFDNAFRTALYVYVLDMR